MNIDDFNRSEIDQIVNLVTDIIMSISVLGLLYYKNLEVIKMVQKQRLKKGGFSQVLRDNNSFTSS